MVVGAADILESVYNASRQQVADAMRSLVAMRPIVTVDPALPLPALEVYEVDRLDFAGAYTPSSASNADPVDG